MMSEQNNQPTRRGFLKTGSLAFCYLVGGQSLLLTPSEARAASVPMRVLTEQEVATLEAVSEAIVPGSRAAGIAHYLDYQLAAKPEESLLMAKYLGLDPPLTPFYQSGLAAVTQAAIQLFERNWSQLSQEQSKTLVDQIASGAIESWSGPPAPFVFFVLRADACDLVYGTESGSENIGVPYMAHIKPLNNWLADK